MESADKFVQGGMGPKNTRIMRTYFMNAHLSRTRRSAVSSADWTSVKRKNPPSETARNANAVELCRRRRRRTRTGAAAAAARALTQRARALPGALPPSLGRLQS